MTNGGEILDSLCQELANNGRPKIEVTERNKEFLSKCKNRKWISSFSEEEGAFKISHKGLVLST